MFFDNVSAKVSEDLPQRIVFRSKGFSASGALQCRWINTDNLQTGSFWHTASYQPSVLINSSQKNHEFHNAPEFNQRESL